MSNGQRKRGLAPQQQDALSVWDSVNSVAVSALQARKAAYEAWDAADKRASHSAKPAPVLLAYDHWEGRRWGFHLVHPDHVMADHRSRVLGDKAWEAEALAAVEVYRAEARAAAEREGVEEAQAAYDRASAELNTALDKALSTPAPDAKSLSEKMRWLSLILSDVASLTDLPAIGQALAKPEANRETLAFLGVYFDLLRLSGEAGCVPALIADATAALERQRQDCLREEADDAAQAFNLSDGWEARVWIGAWEAEGGSFTRTTTGAFSYIQPDPLTEKAARLLSELGRDPSRGAAIRWAVCEREGWPQSTVPARCYPALGHCVAAETISGELLQLVEQADRARAVHSAAVTACDHPPPTQPTEAERAAVEEAAAALDHACTELLNRVPRNARELAHKAAAVERLWDLLPDEDADAYAYLVARDARAVCGVKEAAA